MPKIIASTFLFLLFLSVNAQFTAVKDEAAIKKALAQATLKTNSIKSAFTQEKSLSMLSEKVVSKGVFYFKKENKIRLEYQKPFTYLMLINNGKVTVKDGNKSSTIDTRKSEVFKQVNKIIVDCVTGNLVSNSNFKVQLFESGSQLKVVMVPAGGPMKEFFKEIVVFFAKADYSADKIELNEVGGDSTIISFYNKEINGTVDDALFAVK